MKCNNYNKIDTTGIADKIVIGEAVQGAGGHRLTAVRSKLGLLLSGPVESTVSTLAMHLNLIISQEREVAQLCCT